jgi:hypothetical protein
MPHPAAKERREPPARHTDAASGAPPEFTGDHRCTLRPTDMIPDLAPGAATWGIVDLTQGCP